MNRVIWKRNDANGPGPHPACQGGEEAEQLRAATATAPDPTLLARAVNEAGQLRGCDSTTSFTTSTSEVGSSASRSGSFSLLAFFTALASRAGSRQSPLRSRESRSGYTAVLLDWVEGAVILALYGWLAYRMLAVYSTKGSWADLILLPSEGLVVVLILVRRGTREISRRPADWLLAVVATTSPLLVVSGLGRPLVPVAVAAVVMLAGMLVQVHAKLALGRSFGCVPANRGLKFGGPYCYVRHPMYAGYMVTHVGFLLLNPTAWNVFVYALCYAFQVPRLLAEERLLGRDSRYKSYSDEVRYRLIPGVF